MGFINLAEKTVHAKLVYYGIGAGGKTTSLQAVHGIMCPSNEVKLVSIKTEQDATLLFDFLPINLGTVEGYQIIIQGFTVPGQPKYRRMRKYVLQGADAVVLVVDSQRSRLEENIEALESLLENLRGNGIDPRSIPIVIQYNKRDLDDILTEEEMNPHFLIRDDVQAFPSVATDSQGVYETFVHAAGRLVEQKIKQYDLGKGQVSASDVAKSARIKLWSIFDLWRAHQEERPGVDEVLAFTVDEEQGESGGGEIQRRLSEVFPDDLDLNAEVGPRDVDVAVDSFDATLAQIEEPAFPGAKSVDIGPDGSGPEEAPSAQHESERVEPKSRAGLWTSSATEIPGDDEVWGVDAGQSRAPESSAADAGNVEEREPDAEPAVVESASEARVDDSFLDEAEDGREHGSELGVEVPAEGANHEESELDADSLAGELFSDEDLEFDLPVPEPENEEVSSNAILDDGESGLLDMALQSNLQMAEAFGELDRYKAALRRKNDELVKITQNTIHDLNKPLSAIKLMLSSVVKGYFGDVEGRLHSAIQNSMVAVEMMERLMGDLMDSIVLDTSFKMRFASVDLGILIADVVRTLRYTIEENDVGLRIEPMPVVMADEWALTKAFMNLIGNAIQYSSPDRDSRIRICCEDDGEFHKVVVADNGIGVPEGDLENLFLRFERGTNATNVSGTGLGLHIVKEAIMGHGGTIDLSSQENVGTTFILRLPKEPVLVPQSAITQTVGAV